MGWENPFLLSSDGFTENWWIATNNILTCIEIIFLIISTIDMVADNLEDRGDFSQFEAEGVGAPDGRLDLCELIIITNTTVMMI